MHVQVLCARGNTEYGIRNKRRVGEGWRTAGVARLQQAARVDEPPVAHLIQITCVICRKHGQAFA